jgi:hypothetical protein
MSRGGRRAGAGRPVVAEHEKRVQLSLSVSPKTKEWMQTQSREQGVTMGTILEVLIDSFEDSCKEDDL